MRKTQLFIVAAALVSPVLFSPDARSQSTSDPAAARALFAEARQLVNQHKYDQACPKFEESLRLDPGVGTLFNLADCWEHVGRTASAWARFLDASAGAKSAGQSDRERVARERAAALEPKLARLTIDVKKADNGLEIKRDSQQVGRAAWGIAVPVDPGVHVIEATAPGKKAWSTRVEVPAKPGTIAVAIVPLEDGPAAAQPAPVAVAPGAPALETETASPHPAETADQGSQGSWNPQKTIGVSLAGVGVAGVVVGTVFALTMKSKNDSASEICVALPTDCKPTEIERHATLVNDAKSARTMAFVGFGVGGAALVAGAAMFFTAPSSTRAQLSIAPLVGSGAAGAQLSGTW